MCLFGRRGLLLLIRFLQLGTLSPPVSILLARKMFLAPGADSRLLGSARSGGRRSRGTRLSSSAGIALDSGGEGDIGRGGGEVGHFKVQEATLAIRIGEVVLGREVVDDVLVDRSQAREEEIALRFVFLEEVVVGDAVGVLVGGGELREAEPFRLKAGDKVRDLVRCGVVEQEGVEGADLVDERKSSSSSIFYCFDPLRISQNAN